MIADVLTVGLKLIDKILPDPKAKAEAQLELLRLQQAGELETLRTELSVMLAEASSTDPYTSRARPSFLYVVYILLLTGIPMALIYAVDPDIAKRLAEGFGAWLRAIPEQLYTLFQWVMLGYIGARSYDKTRGAK